MSSKQFIGEIISHVDSDYTEVNTLVATKDTMLLRINKERFYEVLSDNFAIARSVIDFIRIA